MSDRRLLPHAERAHHAALLRGVLVNIAGLLAKLGGPALILVVGGLVGFMVMAILLPIFKMSSAIH